MEDLQTQVITEGKAEATTYDKFACFCKDSQNEKTAAITEAQDSIADLTGSINQMSADREDLDTEISELNEKVEANVKAQKEADALRAKQKATFVKEKAEMEKAIADLGSAVDTMKEGAGEPMGVEVGLVQLSPVLRTVRKAAWMADALGHTSKNTAVLAMLQGTSKAASADTGDIVDTVEDLEGDFKKKLADLEATETNRIAEHNLQMQQLHDEKNAAEKDLKEAQELKAEKMEKIAEDQQDLSATNAQMTDDQAYIKDLTEKCNHKSREWDQRSEMRSQELTALSTALTIVKEKVGTKTTGTVRLVEKAATVSKPSVVTAPVEASDRDVEDEVDSIASAESFVQLSQARQRLLLSARGRSSPSSQEQEKRDLVLSLLKTRGASIGSAVLTSLASRVSADPFAKIKQLIQELVERLLQEAADEANHKGWCDKELGKAKQARKLKSEAVASLNAALADSESRRDTLTEDIAVLTSELAELEDSLEKTTDERKAESAENKATVTEAEEGKAAVEEAITVLERFYKTAAKAEEVTLLQESPVTADDLPDAGFDSGSKGSQSASTGILGMMEVIQSDFARTIATTQKFEKEAAAEFLEFETTTKVSIGKKTSMKTNKEQELVETEGS